MNSTLLSIIRIIVYSNFFVAACITVLTHLSYILLDLPQNEAPQLLTFVFCSTFFVYNCQRLFRLNPKKLTGKYLGIRLSWIVRNRKIVLVFSLLAAIIAALTVFIFLSKLLLFTIPLGILSILYVLPFYKRKNTFKALRHFPLAKITAVSFVWASTIVLLPVLQTKDMQALLTEPVVLLFFQQFLFIYAITLPFDVRDLKYDLTFNMRTIPSRIGVTKTIRLIHTLLLAVIFLNIFNYIQGYLTAYQLISMLISMVLTGLITAFTSIRRSELFFSGMIEGTMMILYFSVLLLEY